MDFTFEDLARRIDERAAASPSESYTAKLLSKGVERCAKKFGEEAVEAVIAAVSDDQQGLVAESADVLYHLLVMLKASGVPLHAVMTELDGRTAQSGLEEKASRKPE
jgi:phosphoribosyl-ATP pyrophosphohydrolase